MDPANASIREKKRIDRWLANTEKVHIVGMSLGGAMAFHTLINNHHITRVDAYSPPGLYPEDWEKGIGTSCDVNIYCQPGDTVARLGTWPSSDNVKLYTVYPHQEGLSKDPFSAHARVFTGCKKITVLKENPLEENKAWDRYLLTKMHKYLGPLVVFFPITIAIMCFHIARSAHEISMRCLDMARNTIKDR